VTPPPDHGHPTTLKWPEDHFAPGFDHEELSCTVRDRTASHSVRQGGCPGSDNEKAGSLHLVLTCQANMVRQVYLSSDHTLVWPPQTTQGSSYEVQPISSQAGGTKDIELFEHNPQQLGVDIKTLPATPRPHSHTGPYAFISFFSCTMKG
jgi:hypothetical protein